MNTLTLQNYGVEEMNTVEMTQKNGGIFGIDDAVLVGVFIGGFIYDSISDYKATVAAFNKGLSEAR